VEGFSLPNRRSDRIVLEANLDYWDKTRFPRLQRIIFDNTVEQRDAVEMVKTGEGQVDLVTGLSPLETLRVAQSPFAKVVKARGSLLSVFGMFNMRKVDSPWHEVRLRQAANYAINRADLIRYATKGNGMIIPALVPAASFGHDPTLSPYPFDTNTARRLLQEAGYADGLALHLIAPTSLEVQATVVSKMLERGGFRVELQMLTPDAFNRQTVLSKLDQPPAQQTWDIALKKGADRGDFPVYLFYYLHALDGYNDWISEQPVLRQLYEQALHTVDRDRQQAVIHQMERHTRDQAYFLFLYNPIQLYAVNKAVEFVPYITGNLILTETAVTAEHWSIRKQKASAQEQ
jgi:ABC-type transport system substrate-binding protein